jgi:hypothetical protein
MSASKTSSIVSTVCASTSFSLTAFMYDGLFRSRRERGLRL